MRKNVVVIGGGTGTFVTLSALKKYPVDLTAIVSMTDSGGSTGRLRDQLGVLPPGDIRQALVALSEESRIWRDLFTYRFESGDLEGHTFGNIFISSIEKMAGSLPRAIKFSQKLLKTKGTVLPVTLGKCTLFAQLEDGTKVTGEHNIDTLGQDWNNPVKKISKCWSEPRSEITKEVEQVLQKAAYIVIGPGDLYTSLLPGFFVCGMAESVVKSPAKKIFIMNLMTKRGQTDGFKAGKFISELQKYIKGYIPDYVIINKGRIQTDVLKWYEQTCEVEPVINDLKSTAATQIVEEDIISYAEYGKTIADRIQRSLIRHDPQKLGEVLARVIGVDSAAIPIHTEKE